MGDRIRCLRSEQHLPAGRQQVSLGDIPAQCQEKRQRNNGKNISILKQVSRHF
jgi:hypothetical protein